jgi:catechol 2,3-dioxygenase
MDLSDRYCNPPFRITRLSHVCITVRDLDKSCEFYEKLAGMVVSQRDNGAAYLRGIEETCHHSLVLRRSPEGASCDAIGFRVFQDRDLDLAKAYFDALGETSEWSSRSGQERTLSVRHSSGIQFELVARMATMPRLYDDYEAHKGAKAQRLNHIQVVVPDVGSASDKFLDMGFRASEMIVQTETNQRLTMFLHRKNDPHDLVIASGAGPRVHHYAYVTSDMQAMIRACDIAGRMGIGQDVERGPGRHGPGSGFFVYFRDPDGHRLELILPPIQYMDVEEKTRVWNSVDKHMIVPWGGAAPKRWLEEATPFTGVPLSATDNLARWTSR